MSARLASTRYESAVALNAASIYAPLMRAVGRWTVILGGGVLGAAMVLVASAWLFLHALSGASPTEHHNASFKYGEAVMEAAYDNPHILNPTEAICRHEMSIRADRPPHLDLSEAVAGCRFVEGQFN